MQGPCSPQIRSVSAVVTVVAARAVDWARMASAHMLNNGQREADSIICLFVLSANTVTFRRPIPRRRERCKAYD